MMALPRREDEAPADEPAPPALEPPLGEPQFQEKPPLTVDLDAVDDEPADKGAPPEREGGRRHRSDWRKMKDSFEEHRREQDRRYEALRKEFDDYRRQPPQQQQARQQPEADPRKAEIRGVRDQQQALLAMISSATTEEDRRKFTEQYHDLDEKRIALISAAHAPKEQAPALTPDQIAYHTLALEYPDIYADEDLRMEAQVEMKKLMKRYHKPYNIATAREACQRVALANNLGGAGGRKVPQPTDAERARYSAVPPRGSAGGASGAYQPTKFQMTMAKAFTAHEPDLSDQERFIRWMKAVGAKENGLL